VAKSLSPGQAFIKIVHGVGHVMVSQRAAQSGCPAASHHLAMAGLQGPVKPPGRQAGPNCSEGAARKSAGGQCGRLSSGGDQTAGNLAGDIGVDFFPSDASQKPVDIANAAIDRRARSSMTW
jgi:signal recognition particle subunit SRP54